MYIFLNSQASKLLQFRSFVLILLIPFIVGCSNISYLAQGVSGHLTLMSKRQPIDKLLEGDTLSKERREQIIEVQNIRNFAYDRLKLPKNDSYSSFVDIGREAVTWNTIATEKYSIKPIDRCFPIGGCVSYSLFFNKQRAEKEAEKHKELGHDVHIIPSPAYSTLGFFDDPVLSTMLSRNISATAEVIFHELAHQRLYRKNDTAFNEAFASAVGQEGTRLWLKENRPESLELYNDHIEKRWQFFDLLLKTNEELKAFYSTAEEKTEIELKKGKEEIFNRLKRRYAELKKKWGGDKRFDSWFNRSPLNNAKLAVIGVYYKLVPRFSERLKALNYDFEAFYNFYEMNEDKG